MANIAELNVSIGADLREIKFALAELKGGLKSVQKDAGGISKAFDGIKGAIAGALSVGAVIALGKQIFNVTSEFQKFEAVLINTLGSQVLAQASLAQIQETAAKTNFSVSELTDSYIKFANRGVKLTQQELIKLADVANSTGKSFDQLTEAALDSFTGENERLKEFGIIAKKTGETTQFTFKGITTEVNNTQDAIKKYIVGLGDLQGVAGSTAAISATLGGLVSNLGDAFDSLFKNIGDGTTGVLPGLIKGFTDFVNLSAMAFKSIESIKKSANALSVSNSIQNDEEEINNLAKAYQKNGRSIEEATSKAAKDVILSLDKILNGWETVSDEEGVILKERIAAIKRTFLEQKELNQKQLGLIEEEAKKLKLLEEARDKAGTNKEVAKYNALINAQSEYLKNLKEVTLEEYKRSQITLTPISPKGFDTKPLIPENKGLGFSIEIDTINQVAAALAIATNKSQVFGESFDLVSEKSAILNDALNFLVENGVATNSYAIDALKSQMKALGEVTIEVSGLIKQTLTDALVAVGEGIGEMIAGTQSVSGFFDNILMIVIDFVSNFGKLLIGAGVASEAFQKALLNNPYVAIAAGVALVAAAALVKGVLKKGPGGKTPALAQGGLAYGPTLAMVGDNKNAKSDPEVIAPLSKLKSIMGENGGNVNVTGQFRISGSDLVATVEKQNKREGRVF